VALKHLIDPLPASLSITQHGFLSLQPHGVKLGNMNFTIPMPALQASVDHTTNSERANQTLFWGQTLSYSTKGQDVMTRSTEPVVILMDARWLAWQPV